MSLTSYDNCINNICKNTVAVVSVSESALLTSKCPPAQKSCEKSRCSWVTLWRRELVPVSVLVWNSPALPGWWPARPRSPGRRQSCVDRLKAHRALWMEQEESWFLELQSRPRPLLHRLCDWRGCLCDFELSFWPEGKPKIAGWSLSHPLLLLHWNELLHPVSLMLTFL